TGDLARLPLHAIDPLGFLASGRSRPGYANYLRFSMPDSPRPCSSPPPAEFHLQPTAPVSIPSSRLHTCPCLSQCCVQISQSIVFLIFLLCCNAFPRTVCSVLLRLFSTRPFIACLHATYSTTSKWVLLNPLVCAVRMVRLHCLRLGFLDVLEGQMAADQNDAFDAINTSKFKDLPPIQTSFKDKPLPAIREPSKDNGRDTPNSNRTGRGYRRLNPKSSIFNLFSRPKVEKQRGFNESGYAVTPIIEPGWATPSPDLIVREPSLRAMNGTHTVHRRPSTSLSVREDPRKLTRSRTPTSEYVKEEDETPSLPTLFDIYSDSSKVTIALAIDESGTSRLTRPRKSNASHIIPVHIHEERRGSVDSIKGDHKAQSRSGRNSLSQGPFQRKIFALSNDGLILQYPEKGGGERLPERALQLGQESVAFACDLVPGRPYVLQVDQKPSTVSEHHMLHSQTSLLTKIGLKENLPRVGELSILIILDTAEELTSWMNAVRKQIVILGAILGVGVKPEVLEKLSTTAPKLRIKQRVSISQQDQPAFTNFSFPKASPDIGSTGGLRRDSSAAVAPFIQPEVTEMHSYQRRNSNSTIPRKPLPERDGIDRLRKMASFDTNDSPLSVTTHDSAVSFGMSAGKRMLRDKNVSQKSSIGSLHDEFDTDSPVLPRSATTGQLQRPKPNPIIGRPRPDSFVADFPLLWPARKVSDGVSPSTTQQTPSPPMKRLPLKVNPSSNGMSLPRQRPSQSPQKPAPPPTRALPAIPTMPSRPVDRSIENWSRKPQRTPSIKLSLFPNADIVAAPTSAPSHAKVLPSSPADDMVRSQDRPLRRPASIQIRTNHAPFLSSVRPKAAGNRPHLTKAELVPCLRGVASLPRAPMVQKPSSSPLPPLDLGMPILGLAPPAPPPSLPLPKLPPGAQPKAVAV
ncbi:hypothetical protein E4T43_04143, partial [Aureobasidium subglaciale]